MNKMQSVLVSAALATGMAAPASAGVNDPEVIIYRFPGVLDDGGGTAAGIATLFICTNFSGATETIRFVTRRTTTQIASNESFQLAHLVTIFAHTHITGSFPPDAPLNTGSVKGTTAIAATSTNIICTAMVLDAASPKPDGIALHGIRFNPVPGSQE